MPSDAPALLKIQDLHLHYGPIHALKGISLEIQAGEIVALIALPGDGSIALHRRHGFVEVGVLRQVGFKFGQWIDVAILQCSVTP